MFRLFVFGLAVVLAVPAVAAARPEPGWWAGPLVAADGASARVRFDVDAGSGLVQPTVRYRLRDCFGRVRAGRVSFGLAAVTGRRFEAVARRPRLRLRVAGRFDSSSEAHGWIGGRAHGCRLPRMRWTAEPASVQEPSSDEPPEIPDEELEDGEELELEEDEPIEDDGATLADAPPT